jgi:hypothetical protein
LFAGCGLERNPSWAKMRESQVETVDYKPCMYYDTSIRVVLVLYRPEPRTNYVRDNIQSGGESLTNGQKYSTHTPTSDLRSTAE